MKKILLIILLFFALSSLFAFDIVKNGKPNATVIISPTASEAEQYAANQFVNYIVKISGAKLHIKSGTTAGNLIYIGIKPKQKDDDGIILKLLGKSLYLNGNNERGTIYAVYEYLEKYCGVEFYTRDIEKVPSKKTIATPKTLNYSYSSPFAFRDCDFHNSANFLEFFVKQRFNGSYKLSKEMGNGVTLIGWCHTMDPLMPEKKYFKEHPEYYALTNGVRKAGPDSQLCLTNKEMQKELALNVIKKLKDSKNPKMISVSQNDNNQYCECETCKAAYDKYGARSGALIECINYVAKEVNKEYPDVLVETLAYAGTLKTPKNIKLEDNILIRVCNIECNFSDPIVNKDKYAPYEKVWGRVGGVDASTINTKFATYMEQWCQLTKNIFVWDYNANFSNYHIAHPNFQVLQPNIQFFRDHNAISVFCEGDRSNENASFNEIKTYLISKLLWNPDVDCDKLTKDFCKEVYGEGSDEILEILDILKHSITDKHWYLPTYVYDMEWMPMENYIKSVKLFQKALNETEGTKDIVPPYAYLESKRYKNEQNVIDINPSPYNKIYQMYIDFLYGAYLKPDKDFEYIKTECNLPWADKYEYEAEFTKWNETYGNSYINEGNSITPKEKPYPLTKCDKVPQICQGLKDEEWIEIQDTDLKLTDKKPTRIEDPTAGSGTATILNPNNKEWSLMTRFGGNIIEAKKNGYKYADLYVICKTLNKKNDKGDILTLGIYDFNVNQQRYKEEIKVKDINDNDWTCVKVGTWDMRPAKAASFYLSPVDNPDCAEGIIVDRIIAIFHN